jgi:hypothetical protein
VCCLQTMASDPHLLYGMPIMTTRPTAGPPQHVPGPEGQSAMVAYTAHPNPFQVRTAPQDIVVEHQVPYSGGPMDSSHANHDEAICQ